MTDEFDYTTAAIEALRGAGRPMKGEELWDAVMRSQEVPERDRDTYWTGHDQARSILKFRLAAELGVTTVTRKGPILDTIDGYWLSEWGPVSEQEQERITKLEARWAAEDASRSARQAQPNQGPAAPTSPGVKRKRSWFSRSR